MPYQLLTSACMPEKRLRFRSVQLMFFCASIAIQEMRSTAGRRIQDLRSLSAGHEIPSEPGRSCSSSRIISAFPYRSPSPWPAFTVTGRISLPRIRLRWYPDVPSAIGSPICRHSMAFPSRERSRNLRPAFSRASGSGSRSKRFLPGRACLSHKTRQPENLKTPQRK